MSLNILRAYTGIEAYLNLFFSTLLDRKLGDNTIYGPDCLAEAHHQMLLSKSSLSSIAIGMGIAHTTLTRKLSLVSIGG